MNLPKSRKYFGRDAFLFLLEDEGVTHLFGNPGTTELPIMHALKNFPKLTYVLGLQESVVVAMADGYCRASGRLAACNVHVAPGLGNAIGSIYNANVSGSPLIITAGQQEQGHGLMEPLLYGPLVDMARPLVKWATEITRIQDLPRIVRRAAKIALTPPTGPVFLSLPGDVLNQSADLELGSPTRIDFLTNPSDVQLHCLAKKMLSAKRPVILVGTEIISSDAMTSATNLADVITAPVFQQSVPHGAHFPSKHPMFMGALTRNQNEVKETLSPFDLMICLGADVLQMSVWSAIDPMPNDLPVIQIGLRDWEMGKNYPADIAVRNDVRQTLDSLVPLLQDLQKTSKHGKTDSIPNIGNNWSAQRSRRCETIETETSKGLDWLMMTIADSLPRDSIIVDEGLTSTKTLLNFLPYRDRYGYFGMVSGGIGWGLAAANGIQLAQPNRPVVALSGDGSAMYSPQALWTAAHLKLPIVFIIFNNGGYQILKERLLTFHDNDHYVGMSFDNPPINFTSLADSFGINSKRVDDLDYFKNIFVESLAATGPSVIEIMIPQES